MTNKTENLERIPDPIQEYQKNYEISEQVFFNILEDKAKIKYFSQRDAILIFRDEMHNFQHKDIKKVATETLLHIKSNYRHIEDIISNEQWNLESIDREIEKRISIAITPKGKAIIENAINSLNEQDRQRYNKLQEREKELQSLKKKTPNSRELDKINNEIERIWDERYILLDGEHLFDD